MPQVTLADISLKGIALSERVAAMKKDCFRALPEICVERPRLVTQYSLAHALFEKPKITVLDKARLYRYVLQKRRPVVRHNRAYQKGMTPFAVDDRSLFAGSTTGKFKGVPLYPEFMALALWPELRTITRRASNPFFISRAEADCLNEEVFPHWIEHTIIELARKRSYEQNLRELGLTRHAPELKLMQRLVFFLASKPNCISHTIPNFSRAVQEGLRAMADEAREKQATASDPSQQEFFAALGEVLEGIIAYSRNLADEATRLSAREKDERVKRELIEIAEIYSRVPESPARTFREGLTTVWICWTAIHLENPNVGLSLGRLDQLLYDLYEKDMEEHRLTLEQAVELVALLWLKIGDHVPSVPDAGEQLFGGTGSNQAITIGGVDQDGSDAVNDLTYVMLRATELMKLRDPNLNARYYPGVNCKEYLRRLCEVNITTGATPALHNDRAVIAALTGKGETLQQARDYGVIGCVEPGSNGRFYGHSASILMNLNSALELTLYNGCHRHTGLNKLISIRTGDPMTFTDFGHFREAFERQSRWLIDQSTRLNNLLGRIHQDFYPTPVLSAFFEGPWDKGKDIIAGGATINSSGATIIGLADVADSLSAIQEHVFVEKTCSFDELLKAVNDNFVGHERLHRELLNPDRTPKYGNEHPVADANVRWIVEMLDTAFGEKENYRGGRYRVGYWTMTNHAGFGRLTRALPNGRPDKDNFASGITPVSGRTPALTKALNSVATLPPTCLANGVALNIKYTPEASDSDRMLKNFVASVEGYFSSMDEQPEGGMEIQFNVTNHEKFVKAVDDPESYNELLVRVSGYTAYFKDLNPQMQKEIIDRTEYQLSTGRAIPYDPFPLRERR